MTQQTAPTAVPSLQDKKLETLTERLRLTSDALEDLVLYVDDLDLDRLCALKRMLTGFERTLTSDESALATVKALLQAQVLGLGKGEAVETAHYRIARQESPHRTIKADRLLERGVTPAIIEYATDETRSVFARVSQKRQRTPAGEAASMSSDPA